MKDGQTLFGCQNCTEAGIKAQQNNLKNMGTYDVLRTDGQLLCCGPESLMGFIGKKAQHYRPLEEYIPV